MTVQDREPHALSPAAAATGALDLKRLDASTQKAVREILHQGESANTRAAYRAAARYWLAWFELRYDVDFVEAEHFPLPAEVVIQFIVDHAPRLSETDTVLQHELPHQVDLQLVSSGVKAKLGPMALNTLEARLAAMARLHRDRGLEPPTEETKVRRLMRAVRVVYAKSPAGAPKKKDALHWDRLARLLATCDDTPRGVRDRALLLFAFDSGGRRRSEIVSADRSQLKRDAGDYIFTMRHSKTNQTGVEKATDAKPIVGNAAEALRAWLRLLDAAGFHTGPLFRRIRRGGTIAPEGLAITGVWDIVKARCALSGLDDEGDFSPHSLRSGFMTQAARDGVPLNEAMAYSGHSNAQTAMDYQRADDMKKSKAAGLASRKRQA
ncbi:site-specific integrase [Ramlibacter sp. AN1133]|uniref:site-specific integrase n=1 Tax=Ramlibacter sp. AN1133 TaxID=3133429 RepID=UPI0030BC5ADD